MKHAYGKSDYTCDLGNNLLLRWSRAEDVEYLAQLIGTTFRASTNTASNIVLERYIHRLMNGDHPFMGAGDFAVVEHTKKRGNPIVSCACLWRHQWNYQGVTLQVGRPEFVATHIGYRERGLVRHLFTLLHTRSQDEGHLIQCIQGIPYFYHQFGYEYALEVGAGRTITVTGVSTNDECQYRLRPAHIEDIDNIQNWYSAEKSYALTTTFPKTWLQYQIQMHAFPEAFVSFWILLNPQGIPQGFIALQNKSIAPPHHAIPSTSKVIFALGFAPEVEITTILPLMLHLLTSLSIHDEEGTEKLDVTFMLGRMHSCYTVLEKNYSVTPILPHAWYVRAINIIGLMQQMRSVLEQRLANSAYEEYSGDLKLYFYRGGIRCMFVQGRLVAVEDWVRSIWDADDDISIPPDIFLQLFFGYRSLAELSRIYLDVQIKEEKIALFATLFPSQLSWVTPLG